VQLFDVVGDVQPPLTARERRAVQLLGDALVTALKRRLPLTLELVELDVELRRRALPPDASRSRRSRASRERH
jgi:hypothetical protein